jgi:hypothetical protein
MSGDSAIDQDMIGRGPTRSEMLRIEAIAVSLAEIIHEYPSRRPGPWRAASGELLAVITAKSDAMAAPGHAQELSRWLAGRPG